MNRIRIVADSSCDLITLDEVSFVSVPLTIRTETQEFRDDASRDVETMVDTLRSTKRRSYRACRALRKLSSGLRRKTELRGTQPVPEDLHHRLPIDRPGNRSPHRKGCF